MKKYIILAAIIMAVAAAFWFQQKRINNLTAERDKYRSNTETLLQDVRTYQTKDSLNAAKVGNLELKLSEYKKYRADDAALIKSLQTKNRDLQRVTTAQMETINELRANVRDSIVYLPGDTVTTVLRCIEYSDKWVDFDGCIINNTFPGKIPVLLVFVTLADGCQRQSRRHTHPGTKGGVNMVIVPISCYVPGRND